MKLATVQIEKSETDLFAGTSTSSLLHFTLRA